MASQAKSVRNGKQRNFMGHVSADGQMRQTSDLDRFGRCDSKLPCPNWLWPRRHTVAHGGQRRAPDMCGSAPAGPGGSGRNLARWGALETRAARWDWTGGRLDGGAAAHDLFQYCDLELAPFWTPSAGSIQVGCCFCYICFPGAHASF